MTARALGYTDSKTHRHGLCVAAISILILIHTIPALCAQFELEPVAIQLRWYHQFQFAGYYAAVEKGFYADEGLEVSLREFEPGMNRIAPVLDGRAQYGIADSSLLKLRQQGRPVVVLAQIFQHSPQVLIVRRDSGIYEPDDLVGKKVMMPVDDLGSIPVRAMLMNTLGSLERITNMPHTFRLEDLADGNTDAMTGYLSNEPFHLKRSGVPVNIIDPRNYGIDCYGDNLFTTDKEAISHPRRVEKMIRATLKGWAYALEHKDEIIDLIIEKYNPDIGIAQLHYEAKVVDQMIVPDLVPIGQINPKRYENIAETCYRLDNSDTPIVPDGFIYQAGSAPAIRLTAEERAWLNAHPVISLGSPIISPWNFVDEKTGQYAGIVPDYLDLFGSKLGIKLKNIPGSYGKIHQMAREKKIDGIGVAGKTAEREEFLNFAEPYITLQYSIVTQKESAAVATFADLAYQRTGILEASAVYSYLKKNYPDIELITFKAYDVGILAVLNGEIDAWIGSLAGVVHTINNKGLFGLRMAVVPFEMSKEMRIGVRKDWPELISILNKTIESLDHEEHTRIRSKWLGHSGENDNTGIGTLTPEEQAWLAEHGPKVRVSLVNLPPLQFEQEGEFTGYQVDILEAVLMRAGLQPIYTLDPFAKVFADLKEKKTEISLDFIPTEERGEVVLFSKKKFDIHMGIFARKERQELNSVEALKNAVIASHPGYGLEPKLKRLLPDAVIVHAVDPQGMFRLVSSGKADVVIHGLASGEFMLQKNLINNVVSHGEFLAKGESRLQAAEFVVRKDLPHLMSIIDKTYASIEEGEKQAIWNRWFGKNASKMNRPSIILTDRERAWMAQNHTVQVRVVNMPPYIILPKGGEPEGISIEYLNFIAERAGVKFHYHFSGKTFPQALDGLKKHKGPDLITSMMRTPDREKSILFSTDYFRSPYVIFTHEKDKTFISDIADLYGRIIALPKGTVILEKIKKDFPDIKIVLFDNDIQAIEAVATNRADVYIGNLALASFLILDKGISGLKIAGPSPFGDHVFSMGIRNDWPALASIMDKALATMSQTERAKIRNKYIAIRYEHSQAAAVLKWVGMILSAAVVAIFLFVFWNRQLARKVKAGTVELRENRDYLKSLTDSMPDAVFSVRLPNRKIEWANDTFKVLGYKAVECIGKTTEFLYSSRQDYLAIGEAMAHAIAEGNAVLRLDQTMRKKNGDLFPAEITLSIFKVGKEVSRVTGIVRDISERRQREQRLQEHQVRLKALATQLTVAEESERRRIATDLHDHVGQALALARMQVASTQKRVTDAPTSAKLGQISDTLYDALQDTRQLMFDLSPPSLNELGLSAAIAEWLEAQIGPRYGIETATLDELDDQFKRNLEDSVKAILFRNVRELILNVVKHAQAKKVSIHLKNSNGRLKIIVEDDGLGFDPEAALQAGSRNGGFGLFSIQERMDDLGGSLEIESEPGKGCKAILTVTVGEKG